MCEPAHSIIQYPDSNDDEDDQSKPQPPMQDRLKMGLGERIFALGRRIGNWFHFSKMGNGHSEAIAMTGRAHQMVILPTHTKYEGLWWRREFQIDGHYHGYRHEMPTAHASAKEYHEDLVYSNIKTFRRFLEDSMKKSERPYVYAELLLESVFTSQGRDMVLAKFGRVFGGTAGASLSEGYRLLTDGLNKYGSNVDKSIAMIMGFTRRRELYRSEWADDSKLWSPG